MDELVYEAEMTWRAKGLCDGAKSIGEMATRLEETAAWLRRLDALGCELADDVTDDYATVVLSDAAIEAKLATADEVAS